MKAKWGTVNQRTCTAMHWTSGAQTWFGFVRAGLRFNFALVPRVTTGAILALLYLPVALMVSDPYGLTSAAAETPKQASTCVACHGPKGLSANDLWPNLAGQKRGYLMEQLKAFKEGRRINDLMTPIAKILSEEDMRDLAVYYSNLRDSP